MDITIVRELPEIDWRCFLEENPNSNTFHTPEMFEVFGRSQGYQPQLWAAVQRKRVLALFLPVTVRLFGRAFARLSWRAVDFGGILYSPGAEGEHGLSKLLAAYVRDAPRRVLFTEMRNTYDLQPVRQILESHGFVFEEHLNCLIDMRKGPGELWNSITKSGRRAIQKARIKGVITEEIQSRSMVPVHYGLLKRTFQRAGVPLAHISLFEAVADILVPAGMAKMFLARVGGQPAAASVELPFNRIIYSWFSGYDTGFRKAYPNDHLVWHILEWGATHGYEVFDFGGAGLPGQKYGPRDFKTKYGDDTVCFGRYVHSRSTRALMLSRSLYKAYRSMMQILALPMRQSSSRPDASEPE